MMVAPLKARLIARLVPGTLRSVDSAMDIGRLLDSKSIRPNGIQAYVVPGDRLGGKVDAMTGFFVQNVAEVVGVVISVPVIDDPKATRKVDPTDTTIEAVIAAIVGWAPPGIVGVFTLVRGRILRFDPGLLLYGIEFSIENQLRIVP